MPQINLLPWREHKREQEKKFFIMVLIISVIFVVFILFMVDYYVSALVDNQLTRQQMLYKEINPLEEKIKELKVLKRTKQALIARMLLVQNLQSTRTLMVHLFDELIKVLPPGIYISKLESKTDLITLWGWTESNTNISILMRNIENNAWIQNPTLIEVKKMDGNKQFAANGFKLSFILKANTRLAISDEHNQP